MKNTVNKPFFFNSVLILSVALSTLTTSFVRADGESDYDPRIGHLLWTDGKAHPQLDLDPDSSAFRWLCFSMVDQKDSRIKYTRQGPEQGQAEFLNVQVCTDGVCRYNFRTVVFLIAYDEDYNRPYVVVPGFKIKSPAINEHGIRAMPVVRIDLKEQAPVLKALHQTLVARGLESAPVNFWF